MYLDHFLLLSPSTYCLLYFLLLPLNFMVFFLWLLLLCIYMCKYILLDNVVLLAYESLFLGLNTDIG